MLKRMSAPNGVVHYISPLLASTGVRHAFSTRIGGHSPPPFDSFNLGNPNGCEVQDDRARINHHYRMLQEAAGCAEGFLCHVHQVHGGQVIAAQANHPFDCSIRADAIISDDPLQVASVRVADCVPILIASRDGKQVAAVHSGWRGIIAGVLKSAIEQLRKDGAGDLVAAIGPCIGFESFEVGPEVLDEFAAAFGNDAPIRRRDDGKGYVDLRRAVLLQALQLALNDACIELTDRCTFRDIGEFFSHRRDRGVTGRMAAIIAPAP